MSDKSASSPASSYEIEQLRDEVSTLSQVCRVLVSAIDELRIELQYIAHNGLPEYEKSHAPFVRRMAADSLPKDGDESLQREPKPSSEDIRHSETVIGEASVGVTASCRHPGRLF